jgi:hypothetical protein
LGGPNIRNGSSSEKERPTRMKRGASENERQTNIKILPSKQANGPSRKGPKIETEVSPRRRANQEEEECH